ncbi:MAG: YdcF family protein [Planctomycetes bacterium]|nr:YdcF family protein [Planctomycetota bacterium]
MPEPAIDVPTCETAAPSRIVGRTLAAAFGVFTLLNSVGEWLHRGFEANLWWLDLPYRDPTLRSLTFAGLGLTFIRIGVRPPRGRRGRWLATAIVLAVVGVALVNTATFYQLVRSASLRSRFPVPFSAIVAVSISWVAVSLLLPDRTSARRRRFGAGPRHLFAILLFGALILFFPLAQMLCFGNTDYRRPADAAVVFGSRVFSDGTPSLALADRMRTAIEVFREGLVDHLVFSGGPGDGEFHETDVMLNMALEAGVPRDAIIVDIAGLDTWSTVLHCRAILAEHGFERLLAVSHFYHLPRIKMTFHRAGIRQVYTVPAHETRRLRRLPYFMLREVIAFWAYYLRPLAPGSEGIR